MPHCNFLKGSVDIEVYITLILWSNIGNGSNFYSVKQVVNITKIN
jgi:hypothetical protein